MYRDKGGAVCVQELPHVCKCVVIRVWMVMGVDENNAATVQVCALCL